MDMPDAWGNITIKDWIHDESVPEGCTQLSLEHMRTLKDILWEFKRNICILYFLLHNMGDKSCATMFVSCQKQTRFIIAATMKLKNHRIPKKYIRAFEVDEKKFRDRLEYIHIIIKENMRLTEQYPFWCEIGFDKLNDFAMYSQTDENVSAQLSKLMDEFAEWRKSHEDVIAKHMESVAREIEIRDAHRKAVKDAIKAEKKAAREKKKAENAEVREIRENNRRHMAEYKRLERSFQKYYKGRA